MFGGTAASQQHKQRRGLSFRSSFAAAAAAAAADKLALLSCVWYQLPKPFLALRSTSCLAHGHALYIGF